MEKGSYTQFNLQTRRPVCISFTLEGRGKHCTQPQQRQPKEGKAINYGVFLLLGVESLTVGSTTGVPMSPGPVYGNAEETSRRWILSSFTVVTGLRRMLPLSWCERNSVESRPTPRLVINVDHRIVVNPLSATPLFSPARAALVGLVVYKPRGRRVAKPKICRKAPVSGNAP
ncbi:hypothetical protein DAPPUDRAFT_260961 [Daphnia pulex]|uniref:Uncharacterized protein n=1 Tax=Daphnia pulex TaxID=6669 RepID=E9HK79_DAPPU|nr:hypothetical protein DAPPUDRAFT_260961 [Daphnia pulex]|eukprot:EFX67837.1 hypothetical protein DAPPUDRAFT_260961 [Daphnia pulex]